MNITKITSKNSDVPNLLRGIGLSMSRNGPNHSLTALENWALFE